MSARVVNPLRKFLLRRRLARSLADFNSSPEWVDLCAYCGSTDDLFLTVPAGVPVTFHTCGPSGRLDGPAYRLWGSTCKRCWDSEAWRREEDRVDIRVGK